MSLFKSMRDSLVNTILTTSDKVLDFLDSTLQRSQGKDTVCKRVKTRDPAIAQQDRPKSMRVNASVQEDEDDLFALADAEHELAEFDEMMEREEFEEYASEEAEELIIIDYDESEELEDEENTRVQNSESSLPQSDTYDESNGRFDEPGLNAPEWDSFKEIEIGDTADAVHKASSATMDEEETFVELSYYAEDEIEHEEQLENPVADSAVGTTEPDSPDAVCRDQSSGDEVDTDPLLRDRTEHPVPPIPIVTEPKHEVSVPEAELPLDEARMGELNHNVTTPATEDIDTQRPHLTEEYGSIDNSIKIADEPDLSSASLNPILFTSMNTMRICSNDRYNILIPGIQTDYDIPLSNTPPRVLSEDNKYKQVIDQNYWNSRLRFHRSFVDYDFDNDIPLTVIEEDPVHVTHEQPEVSADTMDRSATASQSLVTPTTPVDHVEDHSPAGSYILALDAIVDQVLTEIEYSEYYDIGDIHDLCVESSKSTPDTSAGGTNGDKIFEHVAMRQSEVHNSGDTDDEQHQQVEPEHGDAIDYSHPTKQPAQMVGEPSRNVRNVVYYSQENLRYQESKDMASILKGLTVTRIPSDSEELSLQVKWELNAKRRAELFISQGEIGDICGEITITRSELKNFSSQAREGYLVFWSEGIKTIRMIIDKVPPSLDDVQSLIIQEASNIIDRKLANLQLFKDSIARITDTEIERNLYYYIRKVYLIQRDNFHDESLENAWEILIATLRKKEIADRSHWISQHGDEYVKFLDASKKLEINPLAYVSQRMKMELPGFQLADSWCSYVLDMEHLDAFKNDILAVDGLLPYLDFELAKITLPNTKDSFLGLIGDGYLGRYIVYKPLEQVSGKLPVPQTNLLMNQTGHSEPKIISTSR